MKPIRIRALGFLARSRDAELHTLSIQLSMSSSHHLELDYKGSLAIEVVVFDYLSTL